MWDAVIQNDMSKKGQEKHALSRMYIQGWGQNVKSVEKVNPYHVLAKKLGKAVGKVAGEKVKFVNVDKELSR